MATGERARRYKIEFRSSRQGVSYQTVKLGKATLIILFLAAGDGGTFAQSHCGHGRFYRPHLSRCVAVGSPLALPYLHRRRGNPHRPPAPERWYVNALIPIRPDANGGEGTDGATPRDDLAPAPFIPYRLDGSRMFDPRPIFPGWRLQ